MNLTDGEWHRLHPATPLLKGGIALIAIAGVIIANLRERLLGIFFQVPVYGDDPVDEIYSRGLVGWALLAILVIVVGIVVVFFLSWRMHTFRVTEDLVEVRSGLLFRTHRRARLDRIQGVTISRPLFARLFGAAKLDIAVAGNDGNVQLAYLASSSTDALRRDILQLASGARSGAGGAQGDPGRAAPAASADSRGGAVAGADLSSSDGADSLRSQPANGLSHLVTQRVNEFLAPELDPDAAPPESVVRIPVGRLVLSVVISGYTLVLIAAVIAMTIGFAQGQVWPVFAILPLVIGSVSYFFNRVTRMLRYSIAGTPDGVRVGHGLLSTNNETLPPGRVHAIGVSQPLFWRPFGWWRVQVDTAGRAASGGAGRENTTVLPVGTAADVRTVLGLMLPAFSGAPDGGVSAAGIDIGETAGDETAGDDTAGDETAGDETAGVIEAGMLSRGGDDGFTNAPRSAAWLRPFSWRRTGFRSAGGVLLLRHGVLARQLAIVPFARVQSVSVEQGPLRRALGLASVRLQTVAGPVAASLDVAATDAALGLFELTSAEAIAYGAADTSHHWRSE